MKQIKDYQNFLYDLNNEVRGTFSHNIMGGSDHYASLLVGGQNFSLERFIFSLFPTWISVLLHKFLLVGINFIGFYLLIRKLFKIDRLQTIFFFILRSINTSICNHFYTFTWVRLWINTYFNICFMF